MSYTTKDFRNYNYYVLYNMNDDIIGYFDNFNELTKIINYRIQDLVKQFRKFGNCLKIVVDNEFYKLYTFVD